MLSDVIQCDPMCTKKQQHEDIRFENDEKKIRFSAISNCYIQSSTYVFLSSLFLRFSFMTGEKRLCMCTVFSGCELSTYVDKNWW